MIEEKKDLVAVGSLNVERDSAENFLAWLDDCPGGLLERILEIERDDSRSKAMSVGRPRDSASNTIVPWEYRCAEKEQSVGATMAYDNMLNLKALLRQELGLDKE